VRSEDDERKQFRLVSEFPGDRLEWKRLGDFAAIIGRDDMARCATQECETPAGFSIASGEIGGRPAFSARTKSE
jgi:hypothetical protein